MTHPLDFYIRELPPTVQEIVKGKYDAASTKALNEALVALGWMYQQYCGPNFGHDFMGAGEQAIEILERYGLGNERDGVNEVALDKLERELTARGGEG